MAGSFQPSAIHESATQMQSDGMHNQSKSFVDNSYANMPVAAGNLGLNEVMRMQQSLRGSCLTLQDFQTLPSLPFPHGYPPQNAYLFSDNGYGRTVFIKEEKGEEIQTTAAPLQRPLVSSSSSSSSTSHNHHHHYHGSSSHHTSSHHNHHHNRPIERANPLPPPRPSSDGCGSESSPLGGAPFSPSGGERDKSGGGRSTSDYDSRRGLMGGGGDKAGSNNRLSSLMVITVPPSYSDGPGSGEHLSPPVGGGTISSSSTEAMSKAASNHHHHHNHHHHQHHQQVLKYAPNGDALLSSSAINYGDSAAMLQDDEDEGFDVNVGNSLDDGILSGNLSVGGGSVTGGAPTSFDLFEGEGEHDPYLEGDQELRLSPSPAQQPPPLDVFRRSGGSTGLAGLTGVGPVNIKMEEDGSGVRPRDNHKLTVDGVGGDGKSKAARPSKAISPNRSGTQTCPVCCKAFSNSSALAKHKLTHSDERKYVCQICTKAFKRQDHLNGHLLTHMNKKPYECRVEGCGKSYCDARSLRRHTENHHSGGGANSTSAQHQQQQSAAAAAAAAIAVQVGASAAAAANSNSVAATPRTTLPPFTSATSAKVESSNGVATSFLASALQQSNRIRYAPALTSVVTSSTAPSTTLPAPVLAPMYTSACSPSLAASASSNESTSGNISSAAGHLQLLAFQQQEQQLGSSSEQGSPLPWPQQQQQHQTSNSANIVYLNGPVGGSSGSGGGQQTLYSDERVTTGRLQARPSSNDGCGPPPPLPPIAHTSSTSVSETVDGYLGQKVVSAAHSRNPSPTLLAQQLAKMPAHIGQDSSVGSVGLRQTPLNSLFSQGNLLQTVGVPPHPLSIDLNQAIQQWAQPTNYAAIGSSNSNVVVGSNSLGSNPKPVECNICQRKFKNIPALNGHMRLHGGYLKKDMADGTRRSDKKTSDAAGTGIGGSGPGSQSQHPPLQTASMSIRALIEEKIIQRRIINPPSSLSPHSTPSILLPPASQHPSLILAPPPAPSLLPPPPPPPQHSHHHNHQQLQQQLSVPHHHRSSPSSERTVYAATSMLPTHATNPSDGGEGNGNDSPADQMLSAYGDSAPSCLNDAESSHLELRMGLAQHHDNHHGQGQHLPQNLTLHRHRQDQRLLNVQNEQRLLQQHDQLLQQQQQQHELRLQEEQHELRLQEEEQQRQQLHRHIGQIHLHEQHHGTGNLDHGNQQHHHHHEQQHLSHCSQHSHATSQILRDDRDDDEMMNVDAYGGGGGGGEGSSGVMDDTDAQSDMQRQIEIIKQGLMANQPVLEKFRRHSDSDHFLSAPRRSVAAGFTTADSLLVDYVQRRVAALGASGGRQRTQRTGSDPGEFTFGQFVSEAFPNSLAEELGDDDEGGCPVTDDDVMDDDVMDAPVMPAMSDDPFLPPSNSDIIDFESLSSTLPPQDEDNDQHHLHIKSEDDISKMLVMVGSTLEGHSTCDPAADESVEWLTQKDVESMYEDSVDDEESGMYAEENCVTSEEPVVAVPKEKPVESYVPSPPPPTQPPPPPPPPPPPTVIATTPSAMSPVPEVTTSAVATPLPPPATGVVISRIRLENNSGVSAVGGHQDDDVFLSPTNIIPTSPIRAKKKKHRPEPLYIPPQVSTCGFQSRLRSPRLWDPTASASGSGGQTSCVGGSGSAGAHGAGASYGVGHKKLMSPPPYTPPPMLSPVRCGPGLFWQVINGSGSLTPKSAPLTPGRMNLSMVSEYAIQEEEDDFSEVPETGIQPHVNIGWQYQARLPPYCPDQRGYNPQIDDITWDPKVEENITEKEMEMYLQFACCAAIPGGGRNKEYALHTLCMCKGNIQEAMIKLMDPSPKLPKHHPLLTYAYAENDKWTVEEFETYQQALMNYDKDFFSISQEIKTKSVKQCIQFYYLWKKICPDEYKRLRTIRRKREIDGTQYNLRSKLEGEAADGEASSTPKSEDVAPSPGKSSDSASDRFICDQPDCFASFASRQALNGHIRIHGEKAVAKGSSGSSNVNGNRSQSPAAPSGADDSSANQAFGVGGAARFGSTTAKATSEEFPCKLCGKIFKKVKSRSAHMKSHRPMDPDKNKVHEKTF